MNITVLEGNLRIQFVYYTPSIPVRESGVLEYAPGQFVTEYNVGDIMFSRTALT